MLSDAPTPKRRKRDKVAFLKKAITLVAGLAFLGVFGGSAMIRVYMQALNPEPQPSAEITETERTNTLAEMEQGYLIVLEREPENQIALEGLVQTRLDMGNLEGAIAPLETLVSLNPDRTDLQALLDEINRDVTHAQ